MQDFELAPRSLVAHIREQLRLETPLILLYPQRQPARFEHTERIKTYLGLRSYQQTDNEIVVGYARQHMLADVWLHQLLAAVDEMLRAQKIILPGVTVLERLIGRARVEAEDELFGELNARIDQATRAKVFALLKVRAGEKTTPFQQLRQAAGRPSPQAFNCEVDALSQARGILPDELYLHDLDEQLVERLAQMVGGLPTQALAQYQEAKRVGLLLLWLWRVVVSLTGQGILP